MFPPPPRANKRNNPTQNWKIPNTDQASKNLTLAFDTAASLGIAPLLDVEDMLLPVPEQFSVMTYLRYRFFHPPPHPTNALIGVYANLVCIGKM